MMAAKELMVEVELIKMVISGSGARSVDSGAAGGYGSVMKVIQLETEVACYT